MCKNQCSLKMYLKENKTIIFHQKILGFLKNEIIFHRSLMGCGAVEYKYYIFMNV